MGFFRNESEPVVEVPEVVESFDQWRIVVGLSEGRSFDLSGSHYDPDGAAEMLRVIDAMADGLRAAGFPTEVQIIRNQTSSR